MEIALLGVLILMNGFFALSEVALISSKRSRLEHRAHEGSIGAASALRLLDHSEKFLSAIQVGITLIGIVTGVYGGLNIADDITPFFQSIEAARTYAYEISLSLTVVIITYVSIVIGELVPKTIALSNPEKISAIVAPVITTFTSVFYPFVKLLAVSTGIINGLLGIKKHTEQTTEAELRHMMTAASHEGVIEREQNVLHEKVFYFSDKKAKHLMTHRTDIEWIDMDRPAEDVRRDIQGALHSRVLCCNGSLDAVRGVLTLKDYYRALCADPHTDPAALLVPPIIIPETADAQKVLDQLRVNESHIAIVVNEYGGFEGIITMHDVMEHIVGQIADEKDPYEADVFVRPDSSVLVSGSAPVETLVGIIDGFTIDFEKTDYSTVAGFVFQQINRIPRTGDAFDYSGYTIEIVDIDGRRIDKVLITKKPVA